MIKAGSLFYAIIISLIIAIITSSLILFSYLTRIQFDNQDMQQRVFRNADSGLNLLVSKQTLVELNQSKVMDLFGTGMDSVQLTRKVWGAFEIVIAKATFKNYSAMRVAQVGFYPDEKKAYSLYLSDMDKPLALCGETQIKGVAYLPKAGLKRAYIEGQSFVGDKLINGEVKNSEKHLPPFNKALMEGLQTIFESKTISDNDSVIGIENELAVDTLINSFNNRSLVLTSHGNVAITSGFYSGNIAIISPFKITVSANAHLENVLLFAPKIILAENFKGTVQAFATDSLIVDKNVRLFYPSVLGVMQGAASKLACVLLNENDTIAGSVFAYKNDNDVMKQVGVMVSKNTEITGQVYSAGFTDFKGIVFGSLMSNKLVLRTPSSVYENHLLNAVIDLEKRSKFYVGINLVEESSVKKVAKWLN